MSWRSNAMRARRPDPRPIPRLDSNRICQLAISYEMQCDERYGLRTTIGKTDWKHYPTYFVNKLLNGCVLPILLRSPVVPIGGRRERGGAERSGVRPRLGVSRWRDVCPLSVRSCVGGKGARSGPSLAYARPDGRRKTSQQDSIREMSGPPINPLFLTFFIVP